MSHIAAFFDIDGTLTTGRVWRGIMDYFTQIQPRRMTHALFWARHLPEWLLVKTKLRSPVAFRRQWAINQAWYYRGLTLAQAEAANNWIVEKYLSQMWRPDSLQLIRKHQQAGHLVMLVSSSPTPLAQRVAAELNITHIVATPYARHNGRYTGRVIEPVCIADYKASLAQKYLHEQDYQIDLGASYAYADSLSDLQLLEMVGNPVATYPDTNLLPIAHARGWQTFPEGYNG